MMVCTVFTDHREQSMQLDITGHQIDLTDALQQHVRGKMRKPSAIERNYLHARGFKY